MFNQKLKTEQLFATRFFESALSPENRKLNHAFMFTGSDIKAQYNLALSIAKILNCQKQPHDNNHEETCTCVNCSWIDQKTHPAVITISPIDYLYGNKGEEEKTKITIAQARYLKQALSIASPYHRVIIFTNAVENEKTGWAPLPLTRKILHSEPANALLKTIEEPSANITFFFLTKDREDMIETIVSRAQTIPVLSKSRDLPDLNILEDFFRDFPPENYKNALELSEKLIETAKENSCKGEDLLNILLEYMRLLLRRNAENKIACIKIIENIKKIQDAQDKLLNYVSPQAVFDSLMSGIR